MARYRISGVPITRGTSKLVGILTNRDLRFETDDSPPDRRGHDQGKPDHRSRGHHAGGGQGDPGGATALKSCPSWTSEGELCGLITIKDIEKSTKYPNSARDQNGRLLCGAAVGVTKDVHGAGRRAGGGQGGRYRPSIPLTATTAAWLRCMRMIRSSLPRPAASSRAMWPPPPLPSALIDAGADCDQGRHRPRLHLHHPRGGRHRRAADHRRGGLRQGGRQAPASPSSPTAASSIPAIFAKAIAAGAHAVMIGSLFAGCGREPRRYGNLSGPQLQGVPRHGQPGRHGAGPRQPATATSRRTDKKLVPEGVEGRVPYKGPLADTVYPDDGRSALQHGLLRRPHHRGAPPGRRVHPHHRRGPEGKPSSRYPDHQGKPQLFPDVIQFDQRRATRPAALDCRKIPDPQHFAARPNPMGCRGLRTALPLCGVLVLDASRP